MEHSFSFTNFVSSDCKYTITYSVGNFAVIPHHELSTKHVAHSSPLDDIELAKMWARTLSVTDENSLEHYLWDKSLYVPPVSTATNTSIYPGYTTLAGSISFQTYPVVANTYTYTYTGNSTPVPGSSFRITTVGGGGGGGGLTGTTYTAVGIPVKTSYVVVRLSDIGVPSAPPFKKIELFDGLTRAECLESFVKLQRDEGKSTVRMTAKQMEVARVGWALELKRLNDERKNKDRMQVVVDSVDDE